MSRLRIKLLGNNTTIAYSMTLELIQKLGHTAISENDCVDMYHLAIAPLLTNKISEAELAEPIIGTLVFHPSPLPYGRGASAIKHAYKRNEPITASTWFWATSLLDAGDICESEIIKIDYSLRPRDFYNQHIIPALLRTLERALVDISNGYVRRIKQVEDYATYDFKDV
jgi:methionyl-tRNA formyltransferase